MHLSVLVIATTIAIRSDSLQFACVHSGSVNHTMRMPIEIAIRLVSQRPTRPGLLDYWSDTNTASRVQRLLHQPTLVLLCVQICVVVDGFARGQTILDRNLKEWNAPSAWTGKPKVGCSAASGPLPVLSLAICTPSCTQCQRFSRMLWLTTHAVVQ